MFVDDLSIKRVMNVKMFQIVFLAYLMVIRCCIYSDIEHAASIKRAKKNFFFLLALTSLQPCINRKIQEQYMTNPEEAQKQGRYLIDVVVLIYTFISWYFYPLLDIYATHIYFIYLSVLWLVFLIRYFVVVPSDHGLGNVMIGAMSVSWMFIAFEIRHIYI